MFPTSTANLTSSPADVAHAREIERVRLESRLRWSEQTQSAVLHLLLHLRAEKDERPHRPSEYFRLRQNLQSASRDYRRAVIQFIQDIDATRETVGDVERVRAQFSRTWAKMNKDLEAPDSYLNIGM